MSLLSGESEAELNGCMEAKAPLLSNRFPRIPRAAAPATSVQAAPARQLVTSQRRAGRSSVPKGPSDSCRSSSTWMGIGRSARRRVSDPRDGHEFPVSSPTRLIKSRFPSTRTVTLRNRAGYSRSGATRKSTHYRPFLSPFVPSRSRPGDVRNLPAPAMSSQSEQFTGPYIHQSGFV